MTQRENANLVAKILTSKTYSKKLANQEQSYQFIQADQSQSQKNLRQIQINIPNKDTTSCESDYFTFSMQMTVDDTNVTSAYTNYVTGNKVAVVQYKNALYTITVASGQESLIGADMLKSFVDAIENTTHKTTAQTTNTKDYGSFIYMRQAQQGTVPVVSSVGLGNSPTTTTLTDTAQVIYANTDASLYGQVINTNVSDGSVLSNNVTSNQEIASMQLLVGYQKVATLPYNSACFVDETALKHANMQKDKELQMQKRQIYRLQYNPSINQETMNQRWYEYYHNDIPQILYATQLTQDHTFSFSFTVLVRMSQLFDIFQSEFLCLFKLANALNLTITLNSILIQNMFKVKTVNSLGGTVSYDVQFIKYNQIQYYNIGCYMLNSMDTIMENKLKEEIESVDGIILPITQTYVETYDSSIGQNKNFMISNGYNSLDYMELGLIATNNRAYFNGYSTLKDVLGEYADLSQVGCNVVAPQKDSIDWYITQYGFYQPQITINGKAQFLGAQYINCMPFFLTINNRGQTTSDSNPMTQNNFDYFNKLNIRLSQFTDKEINDVEPNELNYSGQFLNKMQNNYYNVKIANYMVSNIQSDLTEADSTDTILNGLKTFKVEAIYRFKAILKITKDGDLQLMQQQYSL